MSAKISITDHDSGEQIGPNPAAQAEPQIIKPTPSPSELESPPSFVHPIPTSEPPLQEMAADVPSPEVSRFGTLQPKVDAHPLFSGAKDPLPKNRRWLKRTLAPVLALIVLLVILYLAIDAGIVKGYSHLPFHFFKPPVVASAPVITPAKTATTTTDPYAGWKSYASADSVYSVKYPNGWTLETNCTATNHCGLTGGDIAIIDNQLSPISNSSWDVIELAHTKTNLTAQNWLNSHLLIGSNSGHNLTNTAATSINGYQSYYAQDNFSSSTGTGGSTQTITSDYYTFVNNGVVVMISMPVQDGANGTRNTAPLVTTFNKVAQSIKFNN